MHGSARHLWRQAADLAYRHPRKAAAGGHGLIMQVRWACRRRGKRGQVGSTSFYALTPPPLPHSFAPPEQPPLFSRNPPQCVQAWARAEYDRDNIGNARIVLAEALRRSPDMQQLYVLAGSVELKAGNLGEWCC
jgi:hypothetical protein